VALGAVPLAGAARAQQAAKPARIAYLNFGSPETHGHFLEAFKQGMRALGYVEGKNIVFEIRWAMGKAERLPDLAKELVAFKPDVIAALGGPQARAMQQATTTIPIVIATISDPVGLGLIKSLARPGGNITGLSTLAADHSPKLLELLLAVVPKLSRVAVLMGFDSGRAQLKNLQTAAQTVGVNVLVIEVQTPAGIENAFERMAKENIRAVIAVPSVLFTFQRRQIAELAIKNWIPLVFTIREFPEAGGLMSYGSNLAEQNRRAAIYVDKILKGATPEDLPVEQATTFELVINLKTAKALGIIVPQSLLIRTDEVIQ
jgi:putative ABC transport system substrate-binding protein